jgi:diadenosine tetraphosphatase ApaH/serine/threonine PP2A family protein phosphatase
MRYLVEADIHSNLEALQAVMTHAESQGGFDSIWCLGDIVGYGADPNACLTLLRSYPLAAVSGNHDLAAIDAVSIVKFNQHAKEAILWTREQLTSEHREFLASNPLRREEDGVTLLHGTPSDPVWAYFLPQMMTSSDVAENFGQINTRSCLVGHSHIPFICLEDGAQFLGLQPGQKKMLAQARCVVNPGSVGQPRDGDPRASYALYDADTDTFVHHRVDYDIEAAQAKITAAGLPDILASRLAVGR